MTETLTVSQLLDVINITLQQLGALTVEGEVSDFQVVHNKWVTFKLKDEESVVPCFMTVWQLKTPLEDGMLVRAVGVPKIRDKGFFSFVIETVRPTGEGALKRAFELLQAKLAHEGLFAPERKRALPRFPQHVALITSKQAAAYNDFIKVLTGRLGGLTISFINTQVQGDDALTQIISALNTANTQLQELDVIVLVRGGGSLEDLQAFNDESVVRAVAGSRVPTIVGIGHERDVTLAELAADQRASTPSNAAELLVPSRAEISAAIANLYSRLTTATQASITASRQDIERIENVLRTRFTNATAVAAKLLDNLQRILRALSPGQTLARGYSITTDASGKILKRAGQIASGKSIKTQLHEGVLHSEVTGHD